jgi:hypothetical protein
MKSLFYFISLIVFMTTAANAATITVDNAPGSTADYTSAQAAHNAAQAGDILYIAGSGYSYGYLTITKQLTIIGNGYFLSQNNKTQTNLGASDFWEITFKPGANFTVIRGLTAHIRLDTVSNIMIEGCYTHNIRRNFCSNIIVSKSYISSNILGAYNNYYYSYYSNSGSMLLQNCYYNVTLSSYDHKNLSIKNCVVNANSSLYGLFLDNQLLENSVVIGSIYSNGSITNPNPNNNLVRNCLFTVSPNTYYFSGSNNQNNVDMNTVFVDYDGTLGYSPDAKWQLKAGSPAIGAGYSGEDIGMFGGSDPYVLSGLVGPHIYHIQHTLSSSSPLQVTVKAKVD